MKTKCTKNRWTAMLLAGVMLLTGCGSRTGEKAPELVEAMVTNDAYRPVERGNIGDVGNLEVLKGVVVPQEDCYFFNASATIDDVKVSVGQYVEAGTVLATIRLDELQEAIANITDTIKQEKKNHEQQEKIFDYTIDKYEYQRKAMEETGDTDGVAALKKQRAIEEENHMFDGLMYERQIKQYETELAEKRKLLAEGKLVARHAGYVTYVKNLAKNAEAGASENIVIVADYSKKYVEVQGEGGNLDMNDTVHRKAQFVYTTVGGRKYALSQYEYSKDILAMMEANNNYANIRYEIPSGIDVEVGDFLPVCYAKKSVLDVLIIGKDSLYTEGNDNFVYVKTKDNNKERRDITIGESDEHYIEVMSGLSEGEEVYYSSLALVPGNYKPVTVRLSDYHKSARTNKCQLKDKTEFNLYARENMRVSEVLVAEGDTVKRGDIVLKVKADGGKAELIAAKNAIDAEVKAYNQLCKDYKKQIKELDDQIEAAARRQLELENLTDLMTEPAEDTEEEKVEDAGEEPAEEPSQDMDMPESDGEEEPNTGVSVSADMLYQTEQLTCDKQIAILNHKIAVNQHEYTMKQLKETYHTMQQENSGNGYRNIYADRDGVVTKVNVTADKKVEEGTIIYTIEQDSEKKMLVTMAPMPGEKASDVQGRAGAELNQKVEFKYEEQVYEGVCVARQANARKVYYTEIDGTVYSSKNSDDASDNWQSNEAFYVCMQDASFYEDVKAEVISFDELVFKDAIVLPASMVYTETDKISGSENYYVWRIMGDELVKQYVTISQIVKDAANVVVLAGVSEGDVLASEALGDAEEDSAGEAAPSVDEEN